MKNNIDVLWPTLIGRFINPDHQEIKDGLIKFFEDYQKKDPKGKLGRENHNLYESHYDLHKHDNEYFKKLLKFLSMSFLQMSNYANKNFLTHKDLNTQKFNILINSSWFIKYKKGGSVLPHAHGNCSWCCVYYVQAEEPESSKNGNTYFLKPYLNTNQKDFGSKYDSFDSVDYKPVEGAVLIWPSHISHGSIPSEGEKNRIIVSANAKIELN